MLRRVALVIVAAFGLAACGDNLPPGSTNEGTLGGSPSAQYQKAAYVDAFALGSLAKITPSGWAAPNILLIGFDDPTTPSTSSTIASALATAASNRSGSVSGNLTFISIGGAAVTPSSWPQSSTTLAANLVAQINAYNASLSGSNQVAGIDLDLENGFTAATISSLAAALHGQTLANGKTLLVSSAPQPVGVSGVTVDATNASNLGLSPGGLNNNFGAALAAGSIDYVLAQAYNTGPTGIVLDNVASASGPQSGVNESDPLFMQGIAQALNGDVRASCIGFATLCIPQTTKIFVGEPANQGAGGTYTVFNPSAPQAPPIPYDQATILSSLTSGLNFMYGTSPLYPHVSGISLWALGNDYAPSLYGDTHASAGAFSNAIFGAAAVPPGPSYLLQLTNNGSTQSQVTLVVTGNYYAFAPVSASSNATWCTLTATGTYGCADSSILDTVGNQSAIVQVTTGDIAWVCPSGSGIGTSGNIVMIGGRYNLQVNGDYRSCAFASF